MLFGGKLTSILVCQKCKHVSQSFEDFNDLSLSIKPEDYTYESKRHRLKMLAKKLASFPATLGVNMESPSIQRSSSVPPTPREETSFGGVYDVPVADPRRRSLDFAAVSDGAGIVDDDDSSGLPSPPEAMVDSGGGVVSKGHKIGFAEEPMADMKLKKEWGEKERDDDKKKDGDGWAKFGRRLSMKVGLGKGHKEQKEQKTRPRGRQTIKGVDVPSAVSEDSNSSQSFTMPRSSTSDAGRDKMPPPEARGQVETASVSMASRPIQGHTQTLVTTPTAIVPNAPLTPPFRISQIQRSKSPRPPNPTAQQSAYMQQILADITPASSNPFAFLKPSHNGEPPSSTTTAQLWLKMGQLPGIEECLKMFTAVEILDGENKVGCRRCWKIANGVHKTRPQYQGSDSDESEKPDLESDRNGVGLGKEALPVRLSSSAPSSPTLSATTPPSLLYTHWNLSDSISISTLPTTMSSESATSKSRVPPPLTLNDDSVGSGGPFRGEENRYIGSPAPHMYMTPPESPILTARPSLSQNTGEKSEESLPEQLRTYAGFTIPVISTTAPETPSPVTPRPPAHFDMTYHLTPSVSRHSLLGHSRLRRRRPNESDIDSMDGSSEAESDTSASTCPDDHSDTSTLSSATNVAEDELLHPRRQSRPPSPRSKQIIMRPAYKRYLIATPPPILVIHLKRFQHLAKTHTISFSNGFKKLDDFVTFPEYLDLKPFLAPKKEDFGLGKGVKLKAHDKGQSNEEQRCMYRLYAVVVHIGNMVRAFVVCCAWVGVVADMRSHKSWAVTTWPTRPFLRVPVPQTPLAQGVLSHARQISIQQLRNRPSQRDSGHI
jgi:hypothetical protein